MFLKLSKPVPSCCLFWCQCLVGTACEGSRSPGARSIFQECWSPIPLAPQHTLGLCSLLLLHVVPGKPSSGFTWIVGKVVHVANKRGTLRCPPALLVGSRAVDPGTALITGLYSPAFRCPLNHLSSKGRDRKLNLTQMCVCVCTCMHIYVYMCVYIYVCTHVYRHTHIHAPHI